MVRNMSLCVLKPDACERKIEYDIINDIQNSGFETICFKKLNLSREDIDVLYYESKDQPYYEDLVEYLRSGPVICFIAKKENAVDELNKLVGATNPIDAEDFTLRKKYGQNILKNTIHSSNDNRLIEEIKQLYKVDDISKIITFPCYFKLKDGTFCHTVAENCYEGEKIIGIPKYFCSQSDDVFDIRYFNGIGYFRNDSYSESITYAKLFGNGNIDRIKRYGEDLCVYDISQVERVYNPFDKAREIYNYEGCDIVLKDAKEILNIMVKHLDIPLCDIGIEGSILLEGHRSNSDIDIVVKGIKSTTKLKENFNKLGLLEQIRLYDERDSKLIFSRRKKYKSFYTVAEMIEQEKLRTVGLINGRRFWMQPILGSNLLDIGDRIIKKCGTIKIEGMILDSKYSYLWPAHYKVEDYNGEVFSVECYDPVYMNQALLGDIVYLEGPLYKDIATGEKIIIYSPWNNDLQIFKKQN